MTATAERVVTVTLRKRHAGQRHVTDTAKRFNVLMCGRRFGKTALGIDLACEDALDGKLVGWFAPTYKYLEEAWRELVSTLLPVPGMKKSEQQHRLALPTGGVIECWTMDSEDPGRGRFYDTAIIDEAGLVQRLSHIFTSAIRPTLADRRGSAWFLGTPQGVGDFSRLWQQGQDLVAFPEWASWRMPTASNPFIPPEEIEAMRLQMPEAVFRQEILGEPVDAGDHPIGLEHIAACVAPQSPKPACVWGLDLARSVDFTVPVGLDETGAVCHLERWRSPWGTTRERVKAIVQHAVVYADSTGVGDPIVEDLQRDGVPVVATVFTARVKQQLVEGLIAAIQQHKIRFPDGWLRAELESLTAERTAVGTRYQAPEGLHDDGVIALALAWHGFPYKTVTVKRERVEYGEGKALPWDYAKHRQATRETGEEAMERLFAVPQSRILSGRHTIPRGR